jgi:hypothetical protein
LSSGWCAAALLGACLGIAACRQVIGIEDAQLDPALSAKSAGVAGSSMSALGVGQAGDATAGIAAPSPCEQYCAAVTTNCTGAFAVYTSYDACLAVCAALPEGQLGDRNVNSVQCRLHAALVAGDEVPHYCPIAGPGGNGECGSNCEGLCGIRAQICAPYTDPDVAACLTDCAKLEDLGTYSTDLSEDQYSGPHVQCRLYHVSAAASDDAEHHCLHVDGAAPCR